MNKLASIWSLSNVTAATDGVYLLRLFDTFYSGLANMSPCTFES